MAQPKHPAKTAYDRDQLGPAGVFCSRLYADDRNSFAVVAAIPPTHEHATDDRHFQSKSMRAARLPECVDDLVAQGFAYVSINGFTSWRRTTAECRQINALVLDIDAHGNGSDRADVMVIRDAFERAVATDTLPAPTVAADTGRGIQLVYILKNSVPTKKKDGTENAEVITFARDMQVRLFAAAELAFAGVAGAQVDRSVGDLARVVRLPGSVNFKAGGFKAELIVDDGPTYTLNELAEALPLPKKHKHFTVKNKKGQVIKFDRLNAHRVTKIAELVRLRDLNGTLVGTRDLCFFAFYNSAVQVYGHDEALKRLGSLNAATAEPLPVSDLFQIADTVDKNKVLYGSHKGETGFYPLSNETLVKKLRLTAEEITALNFFGAKRLDERAAAKRRTAENRRRRDEKICRLYGNGLTQAEVAKRVGCSLHTAGDVIRAAKIERGSLPQQRVEAFRRALDLRKKALTNECSKSWHISWCVCPPPASGVTCAADWSFNAGAAGSGLTSLTFFTPPGCASVPPYVQLALAL